MTVRVLLADDHAILRQGLRALLEREHDLRIVGEVQNGRDAITLARKLTPDVVIMDIRMPILNGIDASRRIKALNEKTHIIALTLHDDCHLVSRMFSARASGFIHKSDAFEELVAAIRTVRLGRIYTSPRVTGRVLQNYVKGIVGPRSPNACPLSMREREILQLISEGMTTKTIASSLSVSINTVDTHRRRIVQKLNIRSVAELTKYAIREGITSLEP